MIEYGPISRKLTIDEAILYISFLDHDGHKDWRLPNDKEVYTHPEQYQLADFWLSRDVGGYWRNRAYKVLPVRGKL